MGRWQAPCHWGSTGLSPQIDQGIRSDRTFLTSVLRCSVELRCPSPHPPYLHPNMENNTQLYTNLTTCVDIGNYCDTRNYGNNTSNHSDLGYYGNFKNHGDSGFQDDFPADLTSPLQFINTDQGFVDLDSDFGYYGSLCYGYNGCGGNPSAPPLSSCRFSHSNFPR